MLASRAYDAGRVIPGPVFKTLRDRASALFDEFSSRQHVSTRVVQAIYEGSMDVDEIIDEVFKSGAAIVDPNVWQLADRVPEENVYKVAKQLDLVSTRNVTFDKSVKPKGLVYGQFGRYVPTGQSQPVSVINLGLAAEKSDGTSALYRGPTHHGAVKVHLPRFACTAHTPAHRPTDGSRRDGARSDTGEGADLRHRLRGVFEL